MPTNRPSKESLAEIPEIDMTKAKVLGRGLKVHRRLALPLAGVRQAVNKTQDEVASATGFDQSEISRIERRDDLLISTLRTYVEALGGELELAVRFPRDRRIVIELPAKDAAGGALAEPKAAARLFAKLKSGKGTKGAAGGKGGGGGGGGG